MSIYTKMAMLLLIVHHRNMVSFGDKERYIGEAGATQVCALV